MKVYGLKLIPICFCIVSTPFAALSDSYFDPGLLIFAGENEGKDIDLEQFSKVNSVAAGQYNLSIVVNTIPQGEHDIILDNNNKGIMVPVLTPTQLAAYGVNLASLPKLQGLAQDAPITDLNEYIPDANVSVDLKSLQLIISIPQIYMTPNYDGEIDPSLLDDGISALFMNYMINTGKNWYSGSSDVSKSTTENAFIGLNGGINLGAWRVRTNYSHSYVSGSNFSSVNQSTFNGTHVMRAIPILQSIFKIGEISTSGNIFDAIPMRGIYLASDEQMLPSSMRGFAPRVSGIANSNATVTVRQNGYIVLQTFVPPGHFKIEDIPASGLAGDLEVTIEEDDGSQRVYTQAYSSLPVMVREGALKYEISLGQYDSNQTYQSRKSRFVLGSFIYGLPKNITLYGGTLLANQYSSAVVGTGISLGLFGALSTDITHAKADFGQRYSGQSYRIRYSKSLLSTGTSFDLTALRYSTKDYYSFSDFNNSGFELREGIVPWVGERQRSSFQTSISQSLGDYGSMYLRGTKSHYWGTSSSNTNLSLGYNKNIKGVNFNLDYTIDRLKRENNTWPENHRVSFNINVPMSLFSNDEKWRSMSANYQMVHDNRGSTSQQLGINGSAFENKLSYGISQNYENQWNTYSGGLNASYSGDKYTISTGYSYSDNNKSVNANLNGGLVAHSGGLLFSRTLGTNIAVITAEGAEGAELNSGAMFNSAGQAVVPNLVEYGRNTIALNVDSLPPNVTVQSTVLSAYPTAGAVIKAQFDTRVGYQVIFNLTQKDAKVPFGALASLVEDTPIPNTGIMDGEQRLYMSGLPNSGSIQVQWGNDKGSCRIHYHDLASIQTSFDSPIRMLSLPCQ